MIPGCENHAPSRILVASFSFGNVPYFAWSRRINQAYCSTHGYEYRVFGLSEDLGRHPHWGKVQGVMSLLGQADFLFFLDADAYFADHSQSLETFIDDHMSTAAFVAGTDRQDKNNSWSDCHANSGVFMLKNDAVGRRLVDTWWCAPDRYDRRWLWDWPLEQGALNYIVRQLFTESEFKVIPYHYMNGHDGTFVRHLAGMRDDERLAILKAEAERFPETIIDWRS